MALEPILPDWPAPPRVRALMSTRAGGVSEGPYASLNVGAHVGDAPEAVAENRRRLGALVNAEPVWLEQVHGVSVVEAAGAGGGAVADASVARVPGLACTIMTADCLPVLLCDRAGTVVAAAHAGWRGLCAGVLENAVARMGVRPNSILAWLGAAIGPDAFEVGDDVRDAFLAHNPSAVGAFRPGEHEGKWFADIYLLAVQRLARCGVTAVFGGGLCTYSDAARFHSYRRDGVTGRMAAMVWLEATGGRGAGY